MNVPMMLEGKRVCICGGSGGVGKTTTAASIATWRKKAYQLGISKSEEESAKSRAFERARDALIESGQVRIDGDLYDIGGGHTTK